MNIGKEIRRLRKARGWTQRQLADSAGIAVTTLSSIENGTEPKIITVRAIARALDLPEDYFLQSDGDSAKSDVAIRRLHFYIDLDEGDDLSDEQITLIQKRLIKYGHDLKNLLLYGK